MSGNINYRRKSSGSADPFAFQTDLIEDTNDYTPNVSPLEPEEQELDLTPHEPDPAPVPTVDFGDNTHDATSGQINFSGDSPTEDTTPSFDNQVLGEEPIIEDPGTADLQMDEMSPISSDKPVSPRVIPPTTDRSAYYRYMEHANKMPTGKHSIGEYIASGIGGFAAAWGAKSPLVGMKTTQGLLNQTQDSDVANWQREGAALKNAADLEGRFNESQGKIQVGSQRIGAQLEIEANKLGMKGEELKARINKANDDYEAAIAGIKQRGESADKVLEASKARTKVLESLGIEGNRIKAITASTGEQNAATYGRSVDNAESAAKVPKTGELFNAENDALAQRIPKDVRYQKYWKIDPTTGDISAIQGSFNAHDLQERDMLEQEAGLAAQRRLGGETMGNTPWNPRGGKPKVVPPRRRLP